MDTDLWTRYSLVVRTSVSQQASWTTSWLCGRFELMNWICSLLWMNRSWVYKCVCVWRFYFSLIAINILLNVSKKVIICARMILSLYLNTITIHLSFTKFEGHFKCFSGDNKSLDISLSWHYLWCRLLILAGEISSKLARKFGRCKQKEKHIINFKHCQTAIMQWWKVKFLLHVNNNNRCAFWDVFTDDLPPCRLGHLAVQLTGWLPSWSASS